MSRRLFLAALSLALVASFLAPALGQNYSCPGVSNGGSFCYQQCTVCVNGTADPTTCGGQSEKSCGWDTANKYNINLDFAVKVAQCSILYTPPAFNQQDCAKYCKFNVSKTGLIESQQGSNGNNNNTSGNNGNCGSANKPCSPPPPPMPDVPDYCLCCTQFCHELQELAAAQPTTPRTTALLATQNADAKHTSLCYGDATHDPHFVGAHGTRYDFNGKPGKTYNLVSTKDFQLNVKLIGYNLDGSDSLHTAAAFESGKQFVRTWMGEMGFLWTDAEEKQHTLHLISRRSKDTSAPGLMSKILLDGAPVDFSTTPGNVVDSNGARLDYLGVENLRPYVGETEKWTITIEGIITVGLQLDPAHPFIRMAEDAMTHFSIAVKSLQVPDNVHGVLGQTFRSTTQQMVKVMQYKILNALLREPIKADGASGKGFLDGTAEDYVTSGVLKTDCLYCMYGASTDSN